MEVSRLTLSPEVACQKSLKTKILLWMQDNPKNCLSTNIKKMAIQMRGIGGTQNSRATSMHQMINSQMINRFGTKHHSRFMINYLHKNIPKEVLENAPDEEKNRVREIKEGVKMNESISDEGCIIKKPAKQPEEQTQQATQTTVQPEAIARFTPNTNQLTITINLNIGGLNVQTDQSNEQK